MNKLQQQIDAGYLCLEELRYDLESTECEMERYELEESIEHVLCIISRQEDEIASMYSEYSSEDNEFELTDEDILYYDDNCEEFEELKRAKLFEAQEY
jgi:hypothetical protein